MNIEWGIDVVHTLGAYGIDILKKKNDIVHLKNEKKKKGKSF